MTQDRSIFLHPPEQLEGPHPDETAVTRWLTHQAAEILRGVFHPYEAPPDEPNLLFLEAVQSAAIEGEHDAKAIQLHQNALTDFIAFSLDRSSLLRLHRSMMTGQGHAQPGRYRNVRVRVGDHIPPTPTRYPRL